MQHTQTKGEDAAIAILSLLYA